MKTNNNNFIRTEPIFLKLLYIIGFVCVIASVILMMFNKNISFISIFGFSLVTLFYTRFLTGQKSKIKD